MHRDLDLFLHQHSGLVLINFWESDCEASVYMDELMRELERFQQWPILRLSLTEYRDWASMHGIYGTPALVAYYHNQPLFRLIGRVTPEELLQRFQAYDL